MATRPTSGQFPLWLHPTGQYAKKIRGRYFYFGKDKAAALAEYVRVRDDLESGRVPRPKADGDALTVRELCNRFLTHKRAKVDAGELTARTWAQYHDTCERVTVEFGLGRAVTDITPDDFGKFRDTRAAEVGAYAVARLVQMTRTIFKFAFDEGLIGIPVRYGRRFDKPPARVLRLARAEAGKKLIDPHILRKMIEAAGVQLRAMLLLAINCGMTQSDLSRLPRSAIGGQWLDFPRPKSGVERRCWLWPETAKALKAVHTARPEPLDPDDADLVFLTVHGRAWARFSDPGPDKPGTATDAIGAEFAKLAKRLKVKLPGRIRVLRKTYRTIADGSLDRVAVDYTMGHTDVTMGAVYRERIDNTRLVAVSNHVRRWFDRKRKKEIKNATV